MVGIRMVFVFYKYIQFVTTIQILDMFYRVYFVTANDKIYDIFSSARDEGQKSDPWVESQAD